MGGPFASSNKAARDQPCQVNFGPWKSRLDGDPPKTRVTTQVWDSIEKFQGYRNSAAYKELRMTGDKYAKFRTFLVEGVSN
jgi:hypothetical protein